MKKFSFVFVLSAISLLIYSFVNLKDSDEFSNSSSGNIILQFITYNGYGNNLYIDNVLTGIQPNNDVTVTSFLNIPYDTVYSVLKSGSETVTPVVTVSNIGRTPALDTIRVYLNIEPGGYIDSANIIGMISGATVQATFDMFNYKIGTGYFLKAWISYNADSNRTNDTLNQYSVSLPGYERNVLYEEFTSNASFACFNNNIYLNAFVAGNFENVNAIVYHSGLLGLDSFYIQNPVQNNNRINYYYVSAVPNTIVDGKLPVTIPYGDSINLYTPYLTRLNTGTPLNISVTDETVTEDSVTALVDINILSQLPGNNYVLKINSVQRYDQSDSSGTNGETIFYDIFRAVYPDTLGILISSAPGNYQYRYTYYKEPFWNDSMIYTTVFIQNNNNREIMNSAKSRSIVRNNIAVKKKIISGKADLLNVSYDYSKRKNNLNHVNENIDSVQTSLNIELFESFFPPLGWKVFNQDGFITFQQFTGANGPALGGNKSVILNFYDYTIQGQKDSMYSKSYTNLLSFDTVRFDWAYAQYNSLGSNIDSLIVKISSDGGLTFPREVFRKGGFELATAPITTSYFIPSNSTQWKTHKFSLNEIVSINNITENIPEKFSLYQNYPNPFNPVTVISYDLPVSGMVSLKIYDLLGREVSELINEFQNSGRYNINFNASDAGGLSSGIYFYKLKTDGYTEIKKMVLLK